MNNYNLLRYFSLNKEFSNVKHDVTAQKIGR